MEISQCGSRFGSCIGCRFDVSIVGRCIPYRQIFGRRIPALLGLEMERYCCCCAGYAPVPNQYVVLEALYCYCYCYCCVLLRGCEVQEYGGAITPASSILKLYPSIRRQHEHLRVIALCPNCCVWSSASKCDMGKMLSTSQYPSAVRHA